MKWYGRVQLRPRRPEAFSVREETMRRRDLIALVGGAFATGLATCPFAAAAAEAYPSRPITIIVPFGAGSGTDIVTRIIAQPLGIALNQNIVVDNRQGANGAIAATYVAKAPPDGYTLLMSTNSPHSANPFLLKNIAYDPVKDFAAVTRIGSFTLMLVVNPAVPVKTISELIAYAKAHPGKLSFGSGSNGSAGHLAGEAFKAETGVNMVHVPYKGGAPAMQALLAGDTQLMFDNLANSTPQLKAGKIKALAVTTAKRSALSPELPTLAETGLPGFDIYTWWGFMAPAGTPKEIIAKWNAEVARILATPEMKTFFAQQGAEPAPTSPEEFAALIRREIPKYAKIVKDSGAKVD